MHDPFAWSVPLGRMFGVTVRLHWLFPFVALGWVLHTALYKPYPEYVIPPGLWIDATVLMLILFLSVLLHELGHCFAARYCGGDASEVLLWPLGGLANVELPNRPRAHFITAAAGPAVNLALAVGFALLLLLVDKQALQPVWSPLPGSFPYRTIDAREPAHPFVLLTAWSGDAVRYDNPLAAAVWVARAFWVNYFLFLLNVVLVGFPLDGGRMLQAALWPSMGYRQATLTAVFAGFAVVAVVGLYAIIQSSVLAFGLALFIYVACQRQWILLETGGEDGGALGYDFSQGYTSLERDQVSAAPPARPKVSWWKRWQQRRAARKMLREMERREAEERRMDELLQKVHSREPLTEEEKRFMKRVSERYRDRGGFQPSPPRPQPPANPGEGAR